MNNIKEKNDNKLESSLLSKILHTIKTKTLAQILLVIIFCLFSYNNIGVEFISWSYSISLALKSILVAVLPFLILSAISTSFAKIPRGGFLFAISLLIGVTISNFINLTLAYFFGIGVIDASHDIAISSVEIQKIQPMFLLPNIPKIPNGLALIIGLITGVCCSLFQLKTVEKYANKLNSIVMFFMSKIFVKTLPIFIMGFMLKLLIEGEMKQLMDKQLWATLSVIILICVYLTIWFIIASGFKLQRLKEIFINILPAMITAFSTMSSAATLPLALEAAEKNTKDKTLAYSVVPMIMNFHMLGSSMAVSVAVLIIMQAFHFPLPDYWHFAVFGFYFVINKFAGAGVPAGSIIVALPILKKVLGFSDDMSALVLAFYIVFDPLITLANVTANNLFVIFAQKVISIFNKDAIKRSEDSLISGK